MTSPADSLSSRSDECGTDDPHKHTQPNLQYQPSPGILPLGMVPSSTQPMMPHGHLDIGHSMVPAGYPFVDPYYGSVIASLPEGQAAIHPYYVGVQPGLPLPSDAVEEPVYVNAKQYRGILRRRQSRAKAESENRLIKSRKPYLHESRHLHALKRARGCGGRFLTAKDNANENTSDASQDKASGCSNSCPDSQQNPEQPTTALGLNSSHVHNKQSAETRLVEEHNPEAVGKLDGSNVESRYKS